MSLKKTMHTRGLVTSVDKNGFANVVMNRKNACSGCGSGKANHCSSCLSGSKIQALVLNTINAKKGDLVSVSLSTSIILQGAAVFYLIPVVMVIVSVLVGGHFHKVLLLNETTAALVSGSIGLVFGFFIVRLISERMNADQGMTPIISKIVFRTSDNSVLSNARDTAPSCAGCR